MAAEAIEHVAGLVEGEAALLGVHRDEDAAVIDALLVIARIVLVDAMLGEKAGETAGGGSDRGADGGRFGDRGGGDRLNTL